MNPCRLTALTLLPAAVGGLAVPAGAQGAVADIPCAAGEIHASDASGHSYFGAGIAVSGDRVLVGAQLDDERDVDAGAAYVLELVNGALVEVQKLLPPSPGYGQRFGRAVAIDGHRALVGSENHQKAFGAGAGLLYERTAGGWVLADTLFAAQPEHGADLGASVALEGDRAVLGAPGNSLDVGKVLVFERTAGGWVEVDQLHPAGPETVRGFGTSVEVSGDRILVGAVHSGGGMAAYVFDRGPAGWSQTARLVGTGAEQANGYDHGIALDGDRAVVAVPYESPGRAFVFELAGGTWVQTKVLFGSGDPLHEFGSAVDVRGDRIAVGGVDLSSFGIAEEYVEVFRANGADWVTEALVPRETNASITGFGRDVALWRDSILVGSPADAAPDYDAGGVHVFNLPRRVRSICAASPNSTGSPAALTIGCGASPTELALAAGPVPHTLGLFLVASASSPVPAWDGVLCVAGAVHRTPVVASAGGALRHDLDLEDPAMALRMEPGSTWFVQAWFRDVAAGGTGANFSDGVRVALGE